MAEILTSDWTQINDDADRFERAWKTGPQPRIEDYLAEAEPGLRAGLLEELLRVELELRRRLGERPTPEEYLRRFPEDASPVEAVCGGEARPQLAAGGGGADGLKGPARASSHRPGSHRVLAGL